MTQRLLLASGAVGPPLFVLVFLIEGALRPEYISWRHFVSSLSAGERGWIQITSFILCGALVLGFSLGLRRALSPGRGSAAGPLLGALFGISLIGAGVFVTDPLLGYPPGAPVAPTLEGALHMLSSLVAFTSLTAACFVLARRFAGTPGWRGFARYSVATGFLVALLFVTTSTVAAIYPEGPAGLVQRLSIVIGWGWIALLALRLLRVGSRG